MSAIEQQVVDQAKTAFETLQRLRSNLGAPYPEEYQRPETIALEDELGKFALANMTELEAIADLPLPAEVNEALDVYIQQVMKRKVAWAIFDQYDKQQSKEISSLLEGKTVSVSSLGRVGLSHSDGYFQTSSPGMSNTAIGKFLGFDATLAKLYVGEPDDHFVATIWTREINRETFEFDGISQGAEIEILT